MMWSWLCFDVYGILMIVFAYCKQGICKAEYLEVFYLIGSVGLGFPVLTFERTSPETRACVPGDIIIIYFPNFFELTTSKCFTG